MILGDSKHCLWIKRLYFMSQFSNAKFQYSRRFLPGREIQQPQTKLSPLLEMLFVKVESFVVVSYTI
jgi:hypothetical protein